MTHNPARRALLRGRFIAPGHVLPPGAVEGFHDLCTQCGDCARACPTSIIYRDSDGFPVINFSAGFCELCGKCGDSCETGALVAATEWPLRARVQPGCLSLQGVTCRTCEDQCEQQAIRFRLQTGGRAAPMIDDDLCNGCGGCVASCPAEAIMILTNINQPEGLSC